MSLADRQSELVRTLVAGGQVPTGFDGALLAAARKALLRKRAGEVRRVWPCLAASYEDRWVPVFSAWADGRPSRGSLRDGHDFARAHPPTGQAAIELMVHDARMRRYPTIRVGHGVVVLQFAGRIRVIP